MSPEQLADACGVTVDYVRKIERGDRVPRGVPLLDKLAHALGVSLSDLAEPQPSGHQLVALPPANIVVVDPVAFVWTQDWQLALRESQRLVPSLSKQQRLRFELEIVSQLQVNLGLFDQARDTVLRADGEYARLQLEGLQDPLIEALISNKMGWIELFLGRLEESKEHFSAAASIAHRWEDAHLEADSRHFLARTRVEGTIFRSLYARIYGRSRPDKTPLEEAIRFLDKAQDDLRRTDEFSKGYDRQWLSQALFFLGRSDEAKKELREAKSRLATDPEVLFAQGMLCSLGLLSPELEPEDAIEMLYRSLEEAERVKFPMAISGSLISIVYEELSRKTEKPSFKHLDRLVLALLLHPYVEHPLTRTGAILAKIVRKAVEEESPRSPSRTRAYLNDLEDRVRQRREEFGRLRSTSFSNQEIDDRLNKVKLILSWSATGEPNGQD